MNKNRKGTIYLVHAQGTSRYKLGITSQPMEKYIKSLQSRSPFQLRIVHTIKVKNYQQVEAKLHQKFKDRQVQINGSKEWFQFSRWAVNWEVKPAMNKHLGVNLGAFLPGVLELGGLAIAAYFIVLMLG